MGAVSQIRARPSPILLIGGTDPSGAGLQTDWKTANALHVEASSVVTAVTAQNSGAVLDSGVLPREQFARQLKALQERAFSAIKIGMLGNEDIIDVLSEYLVARPSAVPVILDPVLAASSGGELLSDQGLGVLLSKLLPLITIITPNMGELASLTNLPVSNTEEVSLAAKQLLKLGAKSVLVKGGHFEADSSLSIDFYVSDAESFCLIGERWKDRQNVRGTGCAFATSIAAFMGKGYCLTDALVLAKAAISEGIRHAVKVEDYYSFQICNSHATAQFEERLELKDLPKLVYDIEEIEQTTSKFADCGSMKLGLYPVVDSAEWIAKLAPLGIETIQLRIKTDTPNNKSGAQIEQEIIKAITCCEDYKTRLFINDHWQLALKHNAYGIHLGQEDLAKLNRKDLQSIVAANCRLGLSTHSYAEVARAHYVNPSYIALGPIFATTSKVMPWIPQGVPAVEKWVKLLGEEYPLVAIGGIDSQRAKKLRPTGIGSVAMISAITEARNYVAATTDLLSIWNQKTSAGSATYPAATLPASRAEEC